MIKIGTRASALALAQAEAVKNKLKILGVQNIKILSFKTSGDKIVNKPLYDCGGKGLFIKELEAALLRDEIDLAVHSMKDIPAYFHPELDVLPVLTRQLPNDALISFSHKSLDSLPHRAKIGTCAPRRIAQLRSDLVHVPIRGNIETRLKKAEGLDGIILAQCALKRLAKTNLITQVIHKDAMLPAICQGALAAQFKQDNHNIKKIIFELVDKATYLCTTTERAFLQKINGDCTTSLAGLAVLQDNVLHFDAMLCSEKGVFKMRRTGTVQEAEILGSQTAQELIKISDFKL